MLMFEGDRKVVSIEYQTGELIPEIPALKDSIVDVRCTDSLGRQFIVEMQMNWTESFKSRVLLNASKTYVVQLDKAKKVHLLKPVYALNFTNKIFEKSPEMENEYYHHYKIVHTKHADKQIKGLEFVFIELPKFKPTNRAELKLHDLWLRFLTEIDEQTTEAPSEMLASEDINEALEYMRVAAFTKEQLLKYDQMKIDIITASSMLESAEETGRIEGKAEGLAEGLAQGEAERIRLKAEKEAAQAEKEAAQAEKEAALAEKEAALAEAQAKQKSVVINSYKAGFSVETIADINSLSIDEITNIVNSLPKT
jgi:predicted transposase/invertase (TIGR01784 family)